MRRKKLWHVPGLYSLLGLPILLLLFGPEDVQEKVAFRFFLADDRHHKDESRIRFTSEYVLQQAKGLKATTIDFWYPDYDRAGNYSNNAKLNFIANELERMAIVHDTTVLLKIELGDGITYGEFVWILNQITINDIRRYGLVQNTLYIFPDPIPPNPADNAIYSLEVENYDYSNIKRPSWWERFISDLEWETERQFQIWSYYIRHNYVLLMGFLLFIVLPFIIRIRKLRKIQLQPRYPLQS